MYNSGGLKKTNEIGVRLEFHPLSSEQNKTCWWNSNWAGKAESTGSVTQAWYARWNHFGKSFKIVWKYLSGLTSSNSGGLKCIIAFGRGVLMISLTLFNKSIIRLVTALKSPSKTKI